MQMNADNVDERRLTPIALMVTRGPRRRALAPQWHGIRQTFYTHTNADKYVNLHSSVLSASICIHLHPSALSAFICGSVIL
jgi:hypothetical protein